MAIRTERWFECNQEYEPMPVYTLDLISQRHQHADSRANRLSQGMKWNTCGLRVSIWTTSSCITISSKQASERWRGPRGRGIPLQVMLV